MPYWLEVLTAWVTASGTGLLIASAMFVGDNNPKLNWKLAAKLALVGGCLVTASEVVIPVLITWF